MKTEPLNPRDCTDGPEERSSGLHVVPAAVMMGLGVLASAGNAYAATAVNDSYIVQENTTLTGQNVTSNDTMFNSYSVYLASAPPAHGTLNLNTNGSFTYTPNANYVGPDSFQYALSDSASNSLAQVSLTVVPPATSVPTLSVGGIAALATSVGLLGMLSRRRRKNAKD